MNTDTGEGMESVMVGQMWRLFSRPRLGDGVDVGGS